VQDPRERPMDRAEEADAAHAVFRDAGSDFLSYLKLWEWYHDNARSVSPGRLRRMCQEKFLSFVRMREWHDVHHQLLEIVTEMGLDSTPAASSSSGIDRPRR